MATPVTGAVWQEEHLHLRALAGHAGDTGLPGVHVRLLGGLRGDVQPPGERVLVPQVVADDVINRDARQAMRLLPEETAMGIALAERPISERGGPP